MCKDPASVWSQPLPVHIILTNSFHLQQTKKYQLALKIHAVLVSVTLQNIVFGSLIGKEAKLAGHIRLSLHGVHCVGTTFPPDAADRHISKTHFEGGGKPNPLYHYLSFSELRCFQVSGERCQRIIPTCVMKVIRAYLACKGGELGLGFPSIAHTSVTVCASYRAPKNAPHTGCVFAPTTNPQPKPFQPTSRPIDAT